MKMASEEYICQLCKVNVVDKMVLIDSIPCFICNECDIEEMKKHEN
jgi:hypothetical protein